MHNDFIYHNPPLDKRLLADFRQFLNAAFHTQRKTFVSDRLLENEPQGAFSAQVLRALAHSVFGNPARDVRGNSRVQRAIRAAQDVNIPRLTFLPHFGHVQMVSPTTPSFDPENQ